MVGKDDLFNKLCWIIGYSYEQNESETCFTHMENQIQNVQGKATKLFVRKKREREFQHWLGLSKGLKKVTKFNPWEWGVAAGENSDICWIKI